MQNNYGATPLHILAQHPMPELIKLMLENGADPNATDKDLETPLTLAIKARNVDNVESLITKENINKPNIHEEAALHIACKNGFSEIVDILLMHNADIHQKNEDGNTPIHIATIFKQRECVEILVDNGADFLELNDKYKSAFALSTGEITAFYKRELEKIHKQNQTLQLRHADHVSIAKSKNQRTSSRMSFRSNTSQRNSRSQSKCTSRTASRLSSKQQQSEIKQENNDNQKSVDSRSASRLSSKQQQSEIKQANNDNQKSNNSRSASRLSSKQQQSEIRQANNDDQKSVISRSARSFTSSVRPKSQKGSKLPNDDEEYLDTFVSSIYDIIENAERNFDIQINDVQNELDILMEDLKAHNMYKQNDDLNNGNSEQIEN